MVVFDCGVFPQGLLSKAGPAVRCLELFEEDRIRLVISEDVLAEIKDVLSRPRLRRQNPRLTRSKAEELLENLYLKAEFVERVPQHFTFSRDPNDEPYLNLAIETEASFLVSRDNDLLDLMTDHSDTAKDFRRRFRKVKIVDPVQFLQNIEFSGSFEI